MGRQITPSTPAFENLGSTVHPVNKGGFGVNTEEQIKETIHGVDRLNTRANGIIPVKSDGFADLSYINVQVDYVSIVGPSFYNAALTTEYTISNYSEFTTYTITVSDGTVSTNKEKITLSANIVSDSVILTINGRAITLTKEPSPVSKPTITITGSAITGGVRVMLNGSAYTVAGGYIHTSTDWMIATDAAFTDVVHNGDNDTGNKTSKQVDVMLSSGMLYAKVRYKASNGRYSDWSVAGTLDVSAIVDNIGTPVVTVDGEKTGLGVVVNASTSSFVTDGGGVHASTQWQVASDAAFTSILFDSGDDTVNKLSLNVEINTIHTFYYVRAKHSDGLNNQSGWSTSVSLERSTLLTGIPSLEKAKIIHSDPASGDYFGVSVSISSDGSRVVVGANDKNSVTGAAYIFSRSGTTWSQEAKIVHSDPASNDYFGRSVSISSDGSRVVIGAFNKNNYTGAVYIFLRTGTTWSQEAKIVHSDPASYDRFGNSVSISGDGSRVVVGAYQKNGSTGAAYIFSRTGTTWTQEAKIVYNDPANNDYFGYSVSISSDGTRVVVGAYGKNSAIGATYIFSRTGSTWSQEAKLVYSDPASYDRFGYSVSISSDGTRVVVGAYGKNSAIGATYIFSRTGSTWTQEAKIVHSDPANNDQFGASVSISSDGSRVVVGASGKNSSVGGAYIFLRSGSAWSQEAKIVHNDPANNDTFGTSVSISSDGSRVVVGAYGKNSRTGAAYIFE